MTHREQQQRLDRLAMRYLAAADAGDFDTLAALWEHAATDPALAAALHDLNTALAGEAAAAEASAVAAAAEKHLTSAEVVRPAGGPVTVADVAAELFRHPPGGLPAAAHALNATLRASAEPLPDDLGLSKLTAWAEARFGPAATEYWKAFRQAAIRVRMRVNADTEYQLAARRTKPSGGP